MAAVPVVPLKFYGVWDRSYVPELQNSPDYDYLLGVDASIKWDELQPKGPNDYDWTYLQTILNDSYTRNRKVKFAMGVGPASPTWIYSNGVPSVETDSEKHAGKFEQYPYYLSADYKRLFFELIKQFANFLRNQPQHLFDIIAYVQVKTGCTGDEVAYKGEPINPKYRISKSEWSTFRLETFDQFRVHFNEGDNNKIALLFNEIDPISRETEFKWVLRYITFGFGVKGSAFVRGHHLSDEQPFRETWTPYLLNPKGLQLFSAAEMDQTWKKALYTINIPLNFYWGVINGLNTGLSIWDVTETALVEAQRTPELHTIYRFFNRHAGQIYPSTAIAAFSFFHEGLNAANKTKFPESIYGKNNMKNEQRYLDICKAYSDKGAKMDDLAAATYGQVWQRENQEGFNDAGWEIEEGNYERWITQINPENTSIALFRVRGTINQNSSIYDRFARSFQNSTGRNTMYFKFHEELNSNNDIEELTFKITWLDKNKNSKWALKYQNESGEQTAKRVKGVGDNQWKTVEVTVRDAVFSKSGELGSDFSLTSLNNIDVIFHGIELLIKRTNN